MVAHHHFYAFAQILIALDVRGNAQHEEDVGHFIAHLGFFGRAVRARGFQRILPRHGEDSLVQDAQVERLHHIVIRAQVEGLRHKIVPRKPGEHDHLGARFRC